jgi:hypothetical protein
MKSIAARLADLPASERAVVAERVEQIRSRGGYAVRRRASPSEPAVASFAQERLWFVDALNPGHGAYNITASLGFDGPLNARALASSLKFVVERHETLRTTFSYEGDKLLQVVRPAAAVALPVIDLSGLDAAERERQMEHVMSRELEEGFDLARGPMLRAILLRTSAQTHTLLLTVHHISSDGWSTGILQREVMAAYDSYSRGASPSLPDLVVQYADYAEWQRERFRRDEWTPLIDFWKRELRGAPDDLRLPTCRLRPMHRNLDGRWVNIDLPAELVAALAEMAQRERCTIFMILLSAYAVLLQRFSGQDEVVIGVPVANRGGVELEPLIGFFVNAVPMRIGAGASERFSDLVQRVRGVALQAFQHQELPFEKLVEELEPERELRRNPIFQATFSLQNLPTLDSTEEVDPTFRADRIRGSIKFDLSLHLRHSGRRMVGSLGYATDLLDDETGDILAGQLGQILARAARDPDARIGELVPGEDPSVADCPAGPPEGASKGRLEFTLPSRGIAALGPGGATTWPDVAAAARAIQRRFADGGLAAGAVADLAATGWIGWLAGAAGAMLAGASIRPVEPGAATGLECAATLVDGEFGPGRGQAPDGTGGEPAAILGADGPQLGQAELLRLLARLAARIGLPHGALAATGELGPVDSTLVALLAATASLGLTAPDNPSDSTALLDHATWEGAGALIVGAGQARRIARTTWVPLDAFFLLVVGGPLSPDSARRIVERGGRGIVLSGGGPISPWLFAADLASVAAGVTLGRPLIDLRTELRGADGEPVPFGALGTLWGRSAAGGDLRPILTCPVRRRADGALEARVEEPDEELDEAAGAGADSSGPIPRSLSGIWEDVLGHPIGLDEDFFAAGGHSLRAAQVVTRMKELLRKPITIQKLFEERTVRRLAAYLGEGEDAPQVEHAARLLLEVSSLTAAEAEARLSAMTETA